MARIKHPKLFSDQYGIDPNLLAKIGVLDPTLNVDTKLFIDPFLLPSSKHKEMKAAKKAYDKHFTIVSKLLKASKAVDDMPWKSARQQLSFPELKGTCLGYSAEGVSGSGSGPDTTNNIISTAKQIVDLGVDDPELFVAMSLFEEGFGPDRISDMTTNVIAEQILQFNSRVLPLISVPLEKFNITLKNGRSFDVELPRNPFVKGSCPVILVPADVLRALPISKDWEDVGRAAAQNKELRGRVNQSIAKLWERKTLKDKQAVRKWALSSKSSFETMLEMINGANPKAYDMVEDALGELFWRKLLKIVAEKNPLVIESPKKFDVEGVNSVVDKIIKQFKFLIEERRLSEDLYHSGIPRPEKSAQRLFFAVAYSYCKANNLDLTPEADTNNGPVDFKVSLGFTGRVVVEIKLSTNGKVVSGYTNQLETYKQAEETHHGHYVLINVGKMGNKSRNISNIKAAAELKGDRTSLITMVNGLRRVSASKL